ncbi:unnamed protein product, partial [Ectocarpus sp. 8 AP-2014]
VGFWATVTAVESPVSSSPRLGGQNTAIANTFLHHCLVLESTRCVFNTSVYLRYTDESNAVPADGARTLGLDNHRGSRHGGGKTHKATHLAQQTCVGLLHDRTCPHRRR